MTTTHITRATTQPLAEAGRHLLVFVAYFAFVELGMYFVLPQANVSLVWPATGLALAVVYLMGLRFAVTVGVAAVFARYHTDQGLIGAVAVGIGIAAAAAGAVWVMRRWSFRPQLGRIRDVGVLLLGGVLLISGISSLVGASVMYFAGEAQWEGFGSLWWVCWVAEMIGALLVAPVLFTWSQPSPTHWTPRKITEVAAIATTVMVAAYVVYADVLPPGVAMSKPLSYVVFPVMIWAATRCVSREVALLLVMHAAVAIGFTVAGKGPFVMGELRENLLSLHTHLAILTVSVLMLQAAMAERRSAESALRDSEAKYRLLVENQTDLVIKTDTQGQILFASPSVGEVFGRDSQSLNGRAFAELVPTEGEASEPWRRVMEPPHACYFEHPARTPDGERWLGWAAKAVLNEEGRPVAVVAVGRDVTARRRAEAESRAYLQELAHVGRVSAMGEMAAGLAHELNQPLCAIMTYSQAARRLLDAGEREEDLRRAIERAADNAERAGEIIRQMRSFVRKDEPQFAEADINTIVDDVVELTSAEAKQNRVAVHAVKTPGLPPVHVAEIQIHQVLVNLIRNGIEALGEGETSGVIEVRTRLRPNGRVEVCVEDNGPGIPGDLLEELFEPFVSGKHGGMGLGLSISRSIVESHGGELRVDSRPRGGTEFRFDLPIAAGDELAAGES